MAAAARGFDPDRVAGVQPALGLARQRLTIAQVAAGGSVFTAVATVGGCCRRSVIRLKRIGARASISRTIPSPPRWRPAPPLPRRSESSRTRSGNSLSSASTGVLRVFDIATWMALGSVGVRTGALAAAEGLVVGEVLAGKGQVVHRSLALGWHRSGSGEGRDDEVGDPARGLDVAGGDRGRRFAR